MNNQNGKTLHENRRLHGCLCYLFIAGRLQERAHTSSSFLLLLPNSDRTTMHCQFNKASLLLAVFFLSTSHVSSAEMYTDAARPTTPRSNPFTAKAALIRYWNSHISTAPWNPPPPFLLSKASPLAAADLAYLVRLAATNSLSAHLPSFCSLAHLICSFEPEPDAQSSAATSVGPREASFAAYREKLKHFSNYGTARRGGSDSFKNYSAGANTADEVFKRYGNGAAGHGEGFASYAAEGNLANGSFGNYGFGASGGSSDFKTYHPRVNVPDLLFTTYGSAGKKHRLSFSSYTNDTNSGSEAFTSYGKHASGVPSQFTSYGDGSNTVGSSFKGYNVQGSGGNDSFTSYGETGNNPHADFTIYSAGGYSATDSFSNYRNGANVGDDSFGSYARNANSAKTTFRDYGKSFSHAGTDSFTEYGNGSSGQTTVEFKSYGLGRSFKGYVNKGVTFAGYNKTTIDAGEARGGGSGDSVNTQIERGRFFRELELMEGNVMAMPDIRDRMPARPFLPRAISSRLPFSSSRLADIRGLFAAGEESATEHVIASTLEECERPPSRGETKRCVGSAEDMIDFAVSILGRGVVLRTTENVNGTGREVRVGRVRGIHGGLTTESVSCHQSLYPYLVYYCHAVPRVRVYEADIVDMTSGATINQGVAICHLDTSAWSPGHGAFVALGRGPGQIEVCHWIYENDMTWTVG
ncbi:hypothetical protein SAY86_016616 [Trapa natans]|uniref:BURP domain-containing protein n=1 Tax=Trapa natans TaxID=22666 RepID=A0AAN7LDJ3_TRANT|nr:hypothetical protein SAY86_016616 [Trapa natans]